jgi:hypothetical protein
LGARETVLGILNVERNALFRRLRMEIVEIELRLISCRLAEVQMSDVESKSQVRRRPHI